MTRCLFSAAFIVSLLGPACAQNCPPVSPQPVHLARVFIRQLVFQNAAVLSASDKRGIVSAARKVEKEKASQSGEELASVGEESAEMLRAAYENNGYFKVDVDQRLVPVVAAPTHYDIVLRVRHQGQQYTMGEIRFIHAIQFPESQLRSLFPIGQGEIFSREKIAKGLDELRRVYGRQGFINCTPVPNADLDNSGIATLTIDVDEGKQFRLRNLEILGVDSETKTRILETLELRAGDIYNPEAWERLYLKFPNLADNPDPNAVEKTLDEQNGWIDLLVDFRKKIGCSRLTVSPAN